MEAVGSRTTSVHLYQNTRCQILQNIVLHIHRQKIKNTLGRYTIFVIQDEMLGLRKEQTNTETQKQENEDQKQKRRKRAICKELTI